MYSSNKWKLFLKDAKQRQNENWYKSEQYEADLKLNIIDFGEKNKNDLFDAYKNYKETKSTSEEETKSTNSFIKRYISLDETNLKSALSICKILILTANPIEKAILHHNISGRIKRTISDDIVYYIFKWGEYWVAHVPQVETGSNKDYGTMYTLHKVLRLFTPNVILSLGVAFGIDYKTQKIGDVIVSKRILPYCENKRDDEKIKPVRSQDKTIDNWLHMRFDSTNGFMENITYGDVLSGGTVVSDAKEKDRICLAYENDFIVGGEMEGNALFQIAKSDDIPCAVIKGICDWGVAKNDIFKEIKNLDEENKSKVDVIKKRFSLYEDDIEDVFKDSLQSYAMTKVFWVCNRLFSDNVIFSGNKHDSRLILKKRYDDLKKWLIGALFVEVICGVLILLLPEYEITISMILIGAVAGIFVGAFRVFQNIFKTIKDRYILKHIIRI